jgi:hypothetical protein
MHDNAPEPARINESIPCELCGLFGAVEIADRKLCVDCYQNCGACCAGSDLEAS